jgi:Rab GDP dissociation inhibitor
MYITVVGNAHQVSAKGRYVAIVSTIAETDKPSVEIKIGLDLLGEKVTRFDNITDYIVPKDDGTKTRCFITSSYDATSHFEQMTEEVMDLYRRVFGEELDLSKTAEVETS